jgi:hypothetical protein
MLRLRLGVIGLGLFLAMGGLVLAQDKKPADDKDLPTRGRGTLPANFKKLGLSEEQTQKVIRIHATYRAKVDDLDRQIKELRKEEKSKLDEVLTEEQKARLRELRTGETGTPPGRAKEAKAEKKTDDKN